MKKKLKTLKIGKIYKVTDIGNRENEKVKVLSKEKWEWPEWVAFKVVYLNKDGSESEFIDFTDKYGNCFINVWGVSIDHS